MMLKENVDVLPVTDNEQTITGILTHEDILSAYKMDIPENINSHSNISVKKHTLKMLIKGKKLMKAVMKNVNL